MYKVIQQTSPSWMAIQRLSDKAVIPTDPANTDYASFKKEVLSGEAKLQDAEGVEMSADAAQAFIKELP